MNIPPLLSKRLLPVLAAILFCHGALLGVTPAQSSTPPADSTTSPTRSIRVEGIVVSAATGEFFDAQGLVVSVDSTFATIDSAGLFVATVSTTRDFVTVQAQADGFAPFRQLIALEKGQSSYFISCILDTLTPQQPATPAKLTPPPLARDSATGLPWTISGSIIDSRYDQALQHNSTVLLFDGESVEGVDDGGFRITTPWSGSHTFRLTVPGFQTVLQELILVDKNKNPAIVLATAPLGTEIQRRQITVTASQLPVHTTAKMSQVRLERKELQRTAATISDPVRVLHTLPGVASESDVMARPIVRGGDVLESRIFLDGIPLIQPYHFGGARSIFNQYATDNITLYTSGFPAEFHNAQSALIDVQHRSAAAESLSIEGELSLMQYAAYVGIPLARYNLGLSLHSQGSFYQAFPIIFAKIAGSIKGNRALANLSKTLTLPSYLDHGMGVEWNPTPRLHLSVHETINTDRFKFLAAMYEATYYNVVYPENPFDPYPWMGTTDSIMTQRYEQTMYTRQEVLNMYQADSVKIRDVIDTNMLYASHYNVLQGQSRYTLDENNIFTFSTAWQKRWWDLKFPDEFSSVLGTSNFDVAINTYNGHLKWENASHAQHALKTGVQIDYTNCSFDAWLPRFLNNLITTGSTNLDDFFGPISGDTAMHLPWIDEFGTTLIDRLLITYNGTKRYYNFNLYAQDSWQPTPKLTVDGGLRLETTGADHSITLSPRLQAKYSINATHELMGAVGRYSQNDYDPPTIALTPNLKPENVWHGDVGLESRLLPWLTQKVNGYGKYYTDLLSEVIEPRKTNWILEQFIKYLSEEYNRDPESFDPQELNELLQGFLISKAIYQSSYTSQGKGYSFGAEYFLRFNPLDFWHGWISLSLSRSFRQRMPGWRWHTFPLERPLLISVVNYYRLPRRYEFSVKYRYQSGIPYTNVSMDSTIVIGDYNAKRYEPYQSLDFRFSKGFVGKRLNGHFNFDVMNSFNSPNMFLLDNKTRSLESTTFNLPSTMLYFGVDFKL
jgi:outer membrane receptor protein involved in Fe transport